jgi:hypothetical protein
MAWLQDEQNFPALTAAGINTTVGYRPKSEQSRDIVQYLNHIQQAGLYGILPFNSALKSHPALLGYIHKDEPDKDKMISKAHIQPGNQLTLNRKAPLWKIVDGDRTSWSVLDPLMGASFTINLDKQATVRSFAIWLTSSKGLSLAKNVHFQTNGRTILKAKLLPKAGKQLFYLPNPATLSVLSITVTDVYPGDTIWGSLAEVEAFDNNNRNILLSKPHRTVRITPAETLRSYQHIKSADPTRPVFMTLTSNFHPMFYKRRALPAYEYPEYSKATDVIGYDIYPIFGWNKPEWIHLTHEATKMLRQMSGQRPVYFWIETSR